MGAAGPAKARAAVAAYAAYAAVAAYAAAALLALAAAAGLSCAGRAASIDQGEGGVPGGRIFGEFEDASLFRRSLESAPEMRSWSEREVRDGLSGATIQAKTMGGELPDRVVLERGRILAYADAYGQFWAALAPGTHTLVGRCRGYRDARIVVEVEPGSVGYANFYLERR